MTDQQCKMSYKGVLFATHEDHDLTDKSCSGVMEEAIAEAMYNGCETPGEIARYLVNTSFKHVPDRQLRFNEIMRASSSVGAHVVKLLMSGFQDLCSLSDETDSEGNRLLSERAYGFACAYNVMLYPFTVQYKNTNDIDWEKVSMLVEGFVEQACDLKIQ